MLIVRDKADLLSKLARLNSAWSEVQNKRGEVTLLRPYIFVDFLNALGLKDEDSYIIVLGVKEGQQLYDQEQGQ